MTNAFHPGHTLPALIMITALTRIAIVDFKTQRIPDIWTATIFLSGIFYHLTEGTSAALASLLVSAIGFALMFSLRGLHRKLRGKVGLGLGDVKLVGAAMVWIDLVQLPAFLLLASGSALLAGLAPVAGTGQSELPPKIRTRT